LSIFAVENPRRSTKWALRKRNGLPLNVLKELKMRFVESAAAGLVALAAQMLIVATVML